MGSWRIDFPSEKFTCSPELLDILQSGNNNGEPSFKDFINSLNDEDQIIFSENLENLKKSEKSFKQIASLNRNNNSYKPIIMRVEFIKTNGSQFSLYASILDAVKLESIATSIEQEKIRYRHLFELSPTGILIEDEFGKIIDANPAFCKSLGYSKKELIGNNVQMLAHPEAKNKVVKNIENLMAGKTLKHNQKSIRKDGTVVYMELRETRIQLPSGKFGILCLAEDFTENKKSQKEHLQKEKLQGVLEMAGAVCHELNQPLTTIFITTDLLLDFPKKGKYQEMIEIIKKEAIRISNISDKLMHITHYRTRKYLNGIRIVDLDQSTKYPNK
jgi:PAS domain S-box-containing protein